MREENICFLFYDTDYKGDLEIKRDDEYHIIARNITAEQAMNLAKLYTRKHDEVRLYDGVYEAYLTFEKNEDKPTLDTFMSEYWYDVAKKYGLYVKEDDDMDYTDVDKEKWDNYYGDFNQCGVRIDY